MKLKKYIVWVHNGCEGWSLSGDYDTLKEAVEHESYGADKIITTEVKYQIVEEVK
jgi:hypothetical protein